MATEKINIMSNEQIKHLEFIQYAITRMNTNSFQLKGLTVTITSALFAIYASTQNILFVFIGILPVLIFWFLDAYYLQQERKFSGIYDHVAGIKNEVQVSLFEMPLKRFNGGKYSYSKVFWSKTIAWLYALLITFQLIIGLIVSFQILPVS